jgi:hypothetical protein
MYHKNITFVEKLNVEQKDVVDVVDVHIDENSVTDIVLDFSLDNKILLEAIDFYYKIYKDNIFEILQRLLSIYNITSSSKLIDYIKHICLHSSLAEILRLETCKELCLSRPSDDCYSVLENLCIAFEKTVTITSTSKIDAITVLMRSDKFRIAAINLFKETLDNQSLENKYRYNLIGTLKPTFDRWKESVIVSEKDTIDTLLKNLQLDFYKHFLINKSNDVMYRILSGQFVLQNSIGGNDVNRIILHICNDESISYNSRADATDLLLTYGDGETKELATKIIKHLGTVGSKHNFTIYENAQNAHTNSISQSVIDMLEMLYDRVSTHLEFEFVTSLILKQTNNSDVIKRVLNRIELDHTTYSRLNVSLKSVLAAVFSFIMDRQDGCDADVLLDRLYVELEESDGICSTGILERLVNSLSGFENFMVKISFEEQIEGNLFGRLNARIAKLSSVPCLHHRMCNCLTESCFASKVKVPRAKKLLRCGTCARCVGKTCLHVCGDDCDWNSNLMNKAIEEMLIPTSIPEKRINFLVIYRFYISEIMEEMHSEFKDYISDAEFNLHFRTAMMKYDCAGR